MQVGRSKPLATVSPEKMSRGNGLFVAVSVSAEALQFDEVGEKKEACLGLRRFRLFVAALVIALPAARKSPISQSWFSAVCQSI